jgi:hypothetical protein
MASIFISYRREDAMGFAGALARELERHFDRKDVFMDVTDIPGGSDFPQVIDQAVGASHVLLALIGPRWTAVAGQDGTPRLLDPKDFVRLEIATALGKGVRVIPVLLAGASVPKPDQLPPNLQALSTLQAMQLGDLDWDGDVNRLVDAIREGMYAIDPKHPGERKALPPGFSPGKPSWRAFAWTGGGLMLFGLIAFSIAASLVLSQRAFEARALQAEGQVIELALRASESGDGTRETSYFPVVAFETAAGQPIKFEASDGSDPPAYEVGQRVGVLYDPNAPQKAQLKSLASAWMGPDILGGFGVLFVGIGVPLFLAGIMSRRKWKRRLQLIGRGQPVVTAFREAVLDQSYSVNDRNPYRVVTEWTNPLTAQSVTFRSEYVWRDPTELLRNRSLLVIVDPNNFGEYLMDLSSLPDTFTASPSRGFSSWQWSIGTGRNVDWKR